jgi:hypothetical protein
MNAAEVAEILPDSSSWSADGVSLSTWRFSRSMSRPKSLPATNGPTYGGSCGGTSGEVTAYCTEVDDPSLSAALSLPHAAVMVRAATQTALRPARRTFRFRAGVEPVVCPVVVMRMCSAPLC